MQFVPKKDDQTPHRNGDSAGPTAVSYAADVGGRTWGTRRPIPTAANGPVYGTLATFLPRTTAAAAAVRTPVKTAEAPSTRPTPDNYVNATKLLNTLVAMNSRGASIASDLTDFERGRTTLLPHCGSENVRAFPQNHAMMSSRSASDTSKKTTSFRSSAPLHAAQSAMKTRLATTNDEVVVVVGREADGSSSTSGSFVVADMLRSNLTATDV